MHTKKRRTLRVAVALLVAAFIAFCAYAFMASNTVPGSYAGDGSSSISGYTISNVSYTLNSTDPSTLDAVGFTISPTAAATVKITLDGSTWYDCANSPPGTVSCDVTADHPTVLSAANLRVVATS